MKIELTRYELELIERSLRFFFSHCEDEKQEDKTGHAFDLGVEFENLLERSQDKFYEIFTSH